MAGQSKDQSKPLMLSSRFAPLFWCQFFSAFNDNLLKTSIVFLILFRSMPERRRRVRMATALITLAGAIFIAPYFFLSALGGQTRRPLRQGGDRAAAEVRRDLRSPAVAVAGFVTHSLVVLYVALFGFGVIGSLFGPIKYGILPDHLERRELPAGNALVEGATFIAILLGTIVAGMAAKGGGHPVGFSALVMTFALAVLGLRTVHSENRRGRAQSHHQQEHRDLDLVADPAICAPIRGCGGARW